MTPTPVCPCRYADAYGKALREPAQLFSVCFDFEVPKHVIVERRGGGHYWCYRLKSLTANGAAKRAKAAWRGGPMPPLTKVKDAGKQDLATFLRGHPSNDYPPIHGRSVHTQPEHTFPPDFPLSFPRGAPHTHAHIPTSLPSHCPSHASGTRCHERTHPSTPPTHTHTHTHTHKHKHTTRTLRRTHVAEQIRAVELASPTTPATT